MSVISNHMQLVSICYEKKRLESSVMLVVSGFRMAQGMHCHRHGTRQKNF